MIDHITKSNLQKLLGPQQGACVSIFLSTPHVGLESFDNPTRLKTLLKDAERRLAQLNDPSTSTILLQPVREFLADGDRWRNLEDGLALFSSPQVFCSFRLPGPVDNSVWVGERFHIRPLVPFLKPKDRYYLLAVNQNEVRLFEGTRYGLNENQLTSLPANLVAALNLHPPEGMVEARTASHSVHGKEGAVFHGQGAMSEHQKDDLLAYFRIIDRALHGFLHDKHAPLLFAGVGYLFPIYSQANTYPHLWTEPLAGNPQGLSAVELHRRAVPLLEPHWQRQLIKDRGAVSKGGRKQPRGESLGRRAAGCPRGTRRGALRGNGRFDVGSIQRRQSVG